MGFSYWVYAYYKGTFCGKSEVAVFTYELNSHYAKIVTWLNDRKRNVCRIAYELINNYNIHIVFYICIRCILFYDFMHAI